MRRSNIYNLTVVNEGVLNSNDNNLYLLISSAKYSIIKLNKLFTDYNKDRCTKEEIINKINYITTPDGVTFEINFGNARTYLDIDNVLNNYLDGLYLGIKEIVGIKLGNAVLTPKIDLNIKSYLNITMQRASSRSRSYNEILEYIAGNIRISPNVKLPM